MGRIKAAPTPKEILAKIATDDIDQFFLKNSLNIYEVYECMKEIRKMLKVFGGRRVN